MIPPEQPLKTRVARKEHRCSECGRRIPKGVRYWYQSESEANDFQDHREHTNCEDFKSEPHLPIMFNRDRKSKW